MRCEVVEAKPWHVGYVIRRLRPEHTAYMERLGLNAHRELQRAFHDSAWRRSWMWDGRPVAIGGVSGSVISPDGYVWLALTKKATSRPLLVMREARRQLSAMMATRHEVQSLAVLCDPAAWRFAVALGFCVKTPDGTSRLNLESHKTSAVDILRERPEFRMTVPGYQDGVLIAYGQEA